MKFAAQRIRKSDQIQIDLERDRFATYFCIYETHVSGRSIDRCGCAGSGGDDRSNGSGCFQR